MILFAADLALTLQRSKHLRPREVLVKYQTIERLAGGKPPAEVTGCVCGAYGVDCLLFCVGHAGMPK